MDGTSYHIFNSQRRTRTKQAVFMPCNQSMYLIFEPSLPTFGLLKKKKKISIAQARKIQISYQTLDPVYSTKMMDKFSFSVKCGIYMQ